MLLLDHFYPPLASVLQWNSFHSAWLGVQAFDIGQYLPPRWYAEPGAKFGIEVDVAALERLRDPGWELASPEWRPEWPAPAATISVPFAVATDELEVLVYGHTVDGLQLVGAIEFVSPANKDRPEHRAAFVSKCHGYLLHGVGLVLVDIVTEKHFNLHNELMERVGSPGARMPGHSYATGYRPTGKKGSGRLEVWINELAAGQTLPTVPLWLLGGISVPVRLQETYDQTCLGLRVSQRLTDMAEARRLREAAANGTH